MKVRVAASAPDAARDRRVEHIEPGFCRSRSDRAGGLDVDRRAVDQQGILGGMGKQPVLAEVDRADLRSGGQHRDDDLTSGGGYGGGCRSGSSLRGEALDRL
jgi:hypothetical protein